MGTEKTNSNCIENIFKEICKPKEVNIGIQTIRTINRL